MLFQGSVAVKTIGSLLESTARGRRTRFSTAWWGSQPMLATKALRAREFAASSDLFNREEIFAKSSTECKIMYLC